MPGAHAENGDLQGVLAKERRDEHLFCESHRCLRLLQHENHIKSTDFGVPFAQNRTNFSEICGRHKKRLGRPSKDHRDLAFESKPPDLGAPEKNGSRPGPPSRPMSWVSQRLRLSFPDSAALQHFPSPWSCRRPGHVFIEICEEMKQSREMSSYHLVGAGLDSSLCLFDNEEEKKHKGWWEVRFRSAPVLLLIQ